MNQVVRFLFEVGSFLSLFNIQLLIGQIVRQVERINCLLKHSQRNIRP